MWSESKFKTKSATQMEAGEPAQFRQMLERDCFRRVVFLENLVPI